MHSKPAHVLIVEDDPLLRRYLEDALQECGYLTHSAGDGSEAADWLHAHHVDLVLADELLPGKGGLRLLEEIRQQRQHVPVVAIAGRGHPDAGKNGLSLVQAMGVDATLEKPFSLMELESTLADVLTRH